MYNVPSHGASAFAEPARVHSPPDFVFVCDPGHAWLMVADADIAALGLGPSDFWPLSTRSPAGEVALEEDADPPAFIAAWERRHGRPMTVAEYPTDRDAACRAWPAYGLADATAPCMHE